MIYILGIGFVGLVIFLTQRNAQAMTHEREKTSSEMEEENDRASYLNTAQVPSLTVNRSVSRGIRNNNPLNIRITNARWVGRVPDYDQTDREYLQFTAPVYGLRAAMRIMRTYFYKYKINTVSGLVMRWAPHVENPTDRYIVFVENATGLKDWDFKRSNVIALVRAMGQFENGEVLPYAVGNYNEAWRMATQ